MIYLKYSSLCKIMKNITFSVIIKLVIFMKKTALKLIEWYQTSSSFNLNSKCRHKPTCSQYAKEAYEEHSFPYASYLTTKRILTCNPLFKPSYDPVPLKKEQKRK